MSSQLLYDVNDYIFHTNSWLEDKNINNVGICVRGNAPSHDEIKYYDLLQDILQLQNLGPNERLVTQFYYEWFDLIPNKEIKKHKYYWIIIVMLTKNYVKLDPLSYYIKPLQSTIRDMQED